MRAGLSCKPQLDISRRLAKQFPQMPLNPKPLVMLIYLLRRISNRVFTFSPSASALAVGALPTGKPDLDPREHSFF